MLAIPQLDALAADDPLLRAEKALEAQPAVSALAKDRARLAAPPKTLAQLLRIFVNSTATGAAAAQGAE